MITSRERDKIAFRLSMILTKLNSGEVLDAGELAREFGVSLRTIQRDMNQRFCYLPIKREDGGYSLESYALGKLTFDDIRNFAALSGVRGLFPSLDAGFITEILDSRIASAYLVKNTGYEKMGSKTDLFAVLTEAILKQHAIRFNYHETTRCAKPYKLLNNGGIWYLVADEEGTLKHYALAKLSALKSMEEPFEPDPEMQAIIRDNSQQWFSKNAIEVILEVDSSVSDYFLRRSLFPKQKILEKHEEKIILSTTVSFDEEVLRIVRYWLPHIKILLPETLSVQLRVSMQKYLENI